LEVGGKHITAETLFHLVSQQRPVNNRKATVFWEGVATSLLGQSTTSNRSGAMLEYFYKKNLADYAKHVVGILGSLACIYIRMAFDLARRLGEGVGQLEIPMLWRSNRP
jgi:hypothetical protein